MNKPFTLFVLTVLALGAVLLTAACTFTVNREKPPVLAGPTDSLQVGLNQLVVCEHFSLDGKEASTNGKKKSQLVIDVINGKNIPGGDSMTALAKVIGLEVKKALRDTGEYDHYTVRFMTVKVDGGMTTRNWTGKEFTSAELQ
ncbi:MAG TPA: hypothetical protein VNV35_00735 [Puia sp.]|jgi:hypothetical protein|nr:hypothetical protein [Puia sp.]